MKQDKDLTTLKSFNHFINSVETGLIYNWSMHYDNKNPNKRHFASIPSITKQEFESAYKWNERKKKSIKLVHNDLTLAMTYANDHTDKPELTKEICRHHLAQKEKLSFISFDSFIATVNSFHTVKINYEQWELSECTYSWWAKNFKCWHVIAICSRKGIGLNSFESIAFHLPLARNKKRGRKPNRGTAFTRTDIAAIFNDIADEVNEEESDTEEIPQTPKKPKKLKVLS